MSKQAVEENKNNHRLHAGYIIDSAHIVEKDGEWPQQWKAYNDLIVLAAYTAHKHTDYVCLNMVY